jgi:putative transcriptional regulator
MVEERLLFVATRRERIEPGLSWRGMPSRSSGNSTMKRTRKAENKTDWSAADAMTDEKRHAAAMADPDCKPIGPDDLARMPRVPQVSIIRRALKLSQDDFAAHFHIPVGTLRDWEQGRKEPDAAARAYLRVIAREPETVRRALAFTPRAKR